MATRRSRRRAGLRKRCERFRVGMSDDIRFEDWARFEEILIAAYDFPSGQTELDIVTRPLGFGVWSKLGGANFAPAWHPDGRRIIFASNIKDPKGRDFDIFLINLDGTGLEDYQAFIPYLAITASF